MSFVSHISWKDGEKIIDFDNQYGRNRKWVFHEWIIMVYQHIQIWRRANATMNPDDPLIPPNSLGQLLDDDLVKECARETNQ